MRNRTFVIGDIHGALKSLEQVINKVEPRNTDRFIFLGDYVDGWSESAEVVEYLIKFSKKYNCIFIKGNHDVWAEEWLEKGPAPIIWTQQGGQATLDSYVRTTHIVSESHKVFFRNLKDWFIDEENRIYIHGGWAYREADFPKSALFKTSVGLECQWDRTLLMGAKSAAAGKHGFKATKQFKEVYIGHTATKSHEVEKYVNLWNMDSGCGWYGRLAIMDVDTKEIWYSDYSKDLYPDEKGR